MVSLVYPSLIMLYCIVCISSKSVTQLQEIHVTIFFITLVWYSSIGGLLAPFDEYKIDNFFFFAKNIKLSMTDKPCKANTPLLKYGSVSSMLQLVEGNNYGGLLTYNFLRKNNKNYTICL